MSNAPAPGDVEEALPQLGGAGPLVGAADVDVALASPGRSAVPHSGQCVGMTKGRSVPSRRSTTGPSTSGMTSPALRSTTVSPMSTPLRCTSWALCSVARLTVDPATKTGSMNANGRDPTGAPDVDPDVEELGRDLLGRVLVGDRPARCARGGAEPALHGDLVDLDDDAVDLVLDVVAVLAVVVDVGLDALDGVDDAVAVGDRQPPGRPGRRSPRTGARCRTLRGARARARSAAAADRR